MALASPPVDVVLRIQQPYAGRQGLLSSARCRDCSYRKVRRARRHRCGSDRRAASCLTALGRSRRRHSVLPTAERRFPAGSRTYVLDDCLEPSRRSCASSWHSCLSTSQDLADTTLCVVCCAAPGRVWNIRLRIAGIETACRIPRAGARRRTQDRVSQSSRAGDGDLCARFP